jgi:hypothetical protein
MLLAGAFFIGTLKIASTLAYNAFFPIVRRIFRILFNLVRMSGSICRKESYNIAREFQAF